MTRLLRSLFVIAVVAVVGGQTARADTPVTGAFTVTFALAPGQGACAGNFAVEARGIGETTHGPLFLTIQKCFYVASRTYAGTFALCPTEALCDANSIDAVSGTYEGAADPYIGDFPGFFGPFHGTLTIERNNSQNERRTGTIDFTAITGRFTPGAANGTAYYSLRETRQRQKAENK